MRLLALCVLAASSLLFAQDDVTATLQKQAEAWNRANLEVFMTTYMDSPDITFTGRAGVTRGYKPVLERYRKSYGTPEAMGTLRYSELEVRLLGPDAALVLGRFDLTRSQAGGGNASGRFTLVLRKTSAGWKIIHDHTS